MHLQQAGFLIITGNCKCVFFQLIHFIVTLVQNNRILNLKRKRPPLMNSSGKKPKYIHQIYDDKVCVEQSSVNSLNGSKSSDISDDVIICDLTESDAELAAEITEGSPRAYETGDVEIVEVELDSCAYHSPRPTEVGVSSAAENSQRSSTSGCSGAPSGAPSGALQLNKASSLSLEDPIKMMDSILNESGAISQNINLLGKQVQPLLSYVFLRCSSF
ncbi:heat shock factor protein 2-like [Notothenia coriiceps]|uniref:Heat shock factor protein 2-like n=1 Tax=Notothenia coriiceps TaxID=8208 RepID=A0A6I9N5C4_9TELE|nr:PREDICTED: heat shock factor protein 2-like [Notothenia coriiceps]